MDLDTRPPELARSTLAYAIQQCSSCTYCSHDLGELLPNAVEIVASDDYRLFISDTEVPPLARSFLARGYIYDRADSFADAGWDALHAAWVCDDEGMADLAAKSRVAAATFFQTALELDQEFAPDALSQRCLIVDVLRRAGSFPEAERVCLEAIKDADEFFSPLFDLELQLIRRNDTDAHTVDEVAHE